MFLHPSPRIPTIRALALCLLVILPGLPARAQAKESVSVFHEQNPDGTYSVFVTTDVPCPIQILVTFPLLENVRWDEQLPLDYVVVPNARKARMVTFTPGQGKMSFRYETQWWFGDPETAAHDDRVIYEFPFSEHTTAPVVQGYHGSFTHQGEYAIDFRMREGTEVRAAREGLVIGVKSDSRQGGPDPSFNDHANYVMIYHNDGTFAQYAHLRHGGVTVRRGQRVSARQLIGYSGNTGYSRGPHLHFAVHIPTYHGSETVPTRFRDRTGRIVTPQ